VKKRFLILLILLTGCIIQPQLLSTNELTEWSVNKDTVYYQNKPIAKIVVWEKSTAIPINSTCNRSQDYRSKEHYESIHGTNTLETLIVRFNKDVEMTKILNKFTNTKYKEIRYYK
jgi:hypothetical protein